MVKGERALFKPRVGVVRRAVAAALVGSATLLIGLAQGSAYADVTAVKGSAYGYFSNVSLFGGPSSTRGPTPTVTLASNASNSPQSATAATGSAQYGPATVFSSGPLAVSSQGALGPSGSATSSTSAQNVGTSGQEVLTADAVSSTCTASQPGVSGSTTVTGGRLQTSEGNPNVTGDETFVTVPTNPAPNTAYTGTIESVGDSFRYVFNEQVVNPDGSLSVNAAHQYLLGPTAVGELVIGQSVCGATRTAVPGQGDVTPPVAKLSGPKSQKLGKRVRVRVTCRDEPCRATAGGSVRVPRVGGARARLFRLKEVTATIRRGRTATLGPKLSNAARKAIKRALRRGRRIVVHLRVTVADSAGNKRTLARRVRLRR